MSFHLLIMILHVLGAGLLLGIVILSVLAVIKPPVTKQAMDRLHFISRYGVWGSAWQFLTGVVLYYQDRAELNHQPIFWVKLGLYVIEGILASTLLQRQSKAMAQATASGQTAPGNNFRLTLWIHAGLIIAIAVLGVWLVSGGHE